MGQLTFLKAGLFLSTVEGLSQRAQHLTEASP